MSSQQPSHNLDMFLSGEIPIAWFRGSAFVPPASATQPAVIFPGSFNPLHAGHLKMSEFARRKLGRPVHYELSIRNVDKPDLARGEIADRLQQFPARTVVVLTRAMTFVEKAFLFPQATFVVGADTIRRIANPRYYEDDPLRMLAAVNEIAAAECRFLVFGRLLESHFRELSAIKIPENLVRLCEGVDESQFRHDVSSSELRRRRGC
jgi:nicotinic acid mononucleotide adenylyltransferase